MLATYLGIFTNDSSENEIQIMFHAILA
jgi:hypothetical protein